MKLLNVLFAAALILGAQNVNAKPKIINYSHPDNLMLTNKLPCIAIDDLRPEYSAMDIARAVTVCAKRRKPSEAIELYYAFIAYASFDRERVSDKTARAAASYIRDLIIPDALNARQLQSLNEAQNMLRNDESQFDLVCSKIAQSGPPNYVPYYMLAHGLKAFHSGSFEPLSRAELKSNMAGYNAKALWKKALSQAGC